jgi:23S rRNA pseudouridine1911/1915/1917 synthase
MPDILHVIEEQLPRAELRLDRYVSEIMRLFSRSQIKARELKAKVNGKDAKLSRPVKQGDTLELNWEEAPPQNIIPQDIALDIIYEDERCIVVNKAQGMVVHPGAGNRQNTLANAIYFRMLEKKKPEHPVNGAEGLRPGIVHRLDKDTSGVIIAAYDEETHAFLSQQFKSRRVRKTYTAIICGAPKEINGRIETFIARDPKERKRFTVSSAGKTALTFYKVIKSWNNYSLVVLHPKTGRTHQLRVHMKYLGYPILGDPVYGREDKYFPGASLMLHSKSLEITLPYETKPRVFSTPLPQRFLSIMEILDK